MVAAASASGSVVVLWQWWLCGDPMVAVAALLWQWCLCGREGGPVMVVPLWQLCDANGDLKSVIAPLWR